MNVMETDDNHLSPSSSATSPTGSQQSALDPNPNLPNLKPLLTDPLPIAQQGQGSPCSPSMPGSPGSMGLHIPSPIITKRTRTNSTYDRAMQNPIESGRIKCFNRGKGHGFIVNDKGGEDVFVHISDIEGEYVPKEGDEVTFRVCPIPPKMEKFQAVHVRIVNFTPDVHVKWDAPLMEDEKAEASKTLVVD